MLQTLPPEDVVTSLPSVFSRPAVSSDNTTAKRSNLALRLFVLVLCVFCGISTVFADGWECQNPLPQGNHLQDVCFLNYTEGFAVGDGETILSTQDGGASWQLLHNGPTGRDFLSIQMLDTQNGWVLARQSYPSEYSWIYRTSDGWGSWAPLLESTQTIYAMHWIDENKGWVGTELGLHSTLDGGLTWNLILFGRPIETVFFLNGVEGWCSFEGSVYRTFDGGLSWQSVAAAPYAETIGKIQFKTAQDGWLIEEEYGFNYEAGRVFVSHDGGASWTEQLYVGGSFGPYIHFADIEMLDTLVGFVCTDDGELYRTLDGGNVWTEIGMVERARALEFTDTATGWSVASYGVISHTEDGGLTWLGQDNGQQIGSSEWSNFQFLDALTGFANGWQALLRTTDGGATWQHIPIDPAPTPYGKISASYFIDDQHGWIAWNGGGGRGMILYTDDGGLTMNIQADSIIACDDIQFLNDKVGWAVGAYELYSTTDGGQNWDVRTLPSSGFYCISFMDSLEGWLAGGCGEILHTTDGGLTWTNRDVGTCYYIRSLTFFDKQLGFAVGTDYYNGYVFRTVDGGESWQEVLTMPHAMLWDGTVVCDSFVYAVGQGFSSPRDYSHFYMSTNAGTTWEAIKDIPLADGIFKIAALDPWHIWLLGPGGSIAYGPLGTGTGITEGQITGTQLLQNYPNPFNPYTTIIYDLFSVSSVELTIYNVLGERVRGWGKVSQSAGQHRIVWDGRDDTGRQVASGVYFYRLKAGGFVQTRKMLLLR